MLSVAEIQPSTTARAWRAVRSAAALEAILEPHINLISWQRTLPAGLEDALGTWAARSAASFDAVLPASSYNLGPALKGLVEPVRSQLLMDMAVLLGRFASLTQVTRLRLSFGAVRDDQCRKFHVDHHRFRLVTTYAGPGTEWVPNETVHREAMDHPVDCPCDANREIVRDPAAIRRAGAGDVLLMKGAGHTSVLGAVHRSPPLGEARRPRVVMIASSVDDA